MLHRSTSSSAFKPSILFLHSSGWDCTTSFHFNEYSTEYTISKQKAFQKSALRVLSSLKWKHFELKEHTTSHFDAKVAKPILIHAYKGCAEEINQMFNYSCSENQWCTNMSAYACNCLSTVGYIPNKIKKTLTCSLGICRFLRLY